MQCWFLLILCTLYYLFERLNLPPQKQERKGGWEPCFALKLTLNFRVLIQPYSSRLINNFCRGHWAVSHYQIMNVRGRQGLTRGQCLYLFTVCWLFATLQTVLAQPLFAARWGVSWFPFPLQKWKPLLKLQFHGDGQWGIVALTHIVLQLRWRSAIG